MPLSELANKSTIVNRTGMIEVATPDHETYQFTLEDNTVKFDVTDTPEARQVYGLVLSETDYDKDPEFQEKEEEEKEEQAENNHTDSQSTSKTLSTTSDGEWPIEITRTRTVPEDLVQELPPEIETIVQEDGYQYYVEEMGGNLSFKETVTEVWRIYEDGSVEVVSE